MKALLDTCISCGRPASQPGGGICRYCEIQKLITDGFDRMRRALHGEIPVIGEKLQPNKLQKGANITQVTKL